MKPDCIQGKMVVWGFVKSPSILMIGGVTDGFGNNFAWVFNNQKTILIHSTNKQLFQLV